jgi:hypothetical protein
MFMYIMYTLFYVYVYNEYVVLVGSPLINSAAELDKFGMKII